MIDTGISTGISAGSTRPDGDDVLRRRLARQRRLGSLKACGLVAPLLLFLLVIFILPIALLLTRSIDNRQVAEMLPRTAAVLAAWDGHASPPQPAFDALALDLRAQNAEDIAELAKRLNYYEPGLRSALVRIGRHAGEVAAAPDARSALTALDTQWQDLATWQALKQALPSYTGFYLLASVDLQRDIDGGLTVKQGADAIFLDVLIRTFAVSLTVTLLCLVLGYPLAYFIVTASPDIAKLALLFVLLPFWTSLLVRTTAWVVLLQGRGVVNNLLSWLGLIDPAHPLELIHNRAGVLIAMTHILLPFMVLPIYSVMKRIPPAYMRAAASLGARPARAFLSVYMPLSFPGVSAGCLLVFILALGYYITPALVGGPRDQLLSYFIAYFANQVSNWGMAAALSAVLLLFVIGLFAVYHRLVGLDRLRMG